MSLRLLWAARRARQTGPLLPFDFDEALALTSSRQVLLVAPTHDRSARIADVRAEVAAVPGATLETAMDLDRFGRTFQTRVLDWLAEMSR